MAAVCDVCAKGPGFGKSVSHSHRRTNRRWNPNIQSVRAQVAEALGQIGSSAASAIPQLTLRLKDTDPLVRRKTVLALGQMGNAAKPAIPSLVPLLKDPDLQGDVKYLLEKLGYKVNPKS